MVFSLNLDAVNSAIRRSRLEEGKRWEEKRYDFFVCLSFFADKYKCMHVLLALVVVVVAVLAGVASFYISGGGKDNIYSILHVESNQVVVFYPHLSKS